MQTDTIELNAIRHIYRGGLVALDDINLTIGTGLFGLLGANGAGKSTLMRIVCTLLEPSGGSVIVGGFDAVRARREVRRLIGYLPQKFGAWRGQRVTEVLNTLARLSGLRDSKARNARVSTVIDTVGLGKVAERKVKQLSGGMIRRLGVAQALVHEPRILVVDEPTVGLDPQERLKFRQLMAELSRERIIVLSTHIVADLGTSCGSLALINKGRLLFHGSPAQLVAQAQGKVIDVSVAAAAETTMATCMEVVRREAADGQVHMRGVITRRHLPEGAAPATDITLEEAYLAFMMKHGHGVSAQELIDTAVGEGPLR